MEVAANPIREGLFALIEELNIDFESAMRFANVVKDSNPMHFDEGAAKQDGFETTPLVGTYFCALGERVARSLVPSLGRDIYLVGQTSKFHRPAYPGRKIALSIGNFIAANGGYTAKLLFSQDCVRVADVVCNFSNSLHGPSDLRGEKLYSHCFSMSEEDLEGYFTETGQDYIPDTSFSFSHAEALGPAGLVGFLMALNNKLGKTCSGQNMRMETNFYEPLKTGRVLAEVHDSGSDRPISDRFAYRFETRIYQEGEMPIAVSNVLCCTNMQLDKRALIS